MKRTLDKKEEIKNANFLILPFRNDHSWYRSQLNFPEYPYRSSSSEFEQNQMKILQDEILTYLSKDYRKVILRPTNEDNCLIIAFDIDNDHIFDIHIYVHIFKSRYIGPGPFAYIDLGVDELRQSIVSIESRLRKKIQYPNYTWMSFESIYMPDIIEYPRVKTILTDIESIIKKFLNDLVKKYVLLPKLVLRENTGKVMYEPENLLNQFLGYPNLKGGKIRKSKSKSKSKRNERKLMSPRKSNIKRKSKLK